MIYIVIIQTDVWSIERYFLGYPPFPVAGNEGLQAGIPKAIRCSFKNPGVFDYHPATGAQPNPTYTPLKTTKTILQHGTQFHELVVWVEVASTRFQAG